MWKWPAALVVVVVLVVVNMVIVVVVDVVDVVVVLCYDLVMRKILLNEWVGKMDLKERFNSVFLHCSGGILSVTLSILGIN